MKKILAIAFMVMFVGAITMPAMADNPPKEKAKTTESVKSGTKTTATQTKKDGSKCTEGKKSGCCADKAATTK